MSGFTRATIATVLLLSAGGCGKTTNANSQKAENAAAIDDMANQMTADVGNPFSQSELQMSDKMTMAVGTSVADNWVRKMIEHHQGAVDMSRVVLLHHPSAQAANMAQSTIDKQSKEILDLRKLVQSGTPDPASAALYRPAAMSMHDAMMTAKGADISETFLSKMLAHHRGAIAMSDVALKNGVTGKVRAQVEKTRADQQQEATMVEGMLSGKPMTDASGAAPATNAMNMTNQM